MSCSWVGGGIFRSKGKQTPLTSQTRIGAGRWWRPVIPVLGKLRQEDRELKASLEYIVIINTRGEQHFTQRLDPEGGT